VFNLTHLLPVPVVDNYKDWQHLPGAIQTGSGYWSRTNLVELLGDIDDNFLDLAQAMDRFESLFLRCMNCKN
jgi:hypothetical protein